MTPDLQDKTAVITGSTSGIGLEIANALAGAGANVVINGLGDAAHNDSLRAEIAERHGVTCLFSPANMLHADEIETMIAMAAEQLGGVDILVNNAGIQHVAPLEEFPPQKWDAIIGINLTAPFHAIRAAVPHMKRAGWGRIISTASAHASDASPFKSAYVAAKHGLLGLTKVAALELARSGATANCISPGYVWTPLVEEQIPDTMEARGLTREQVIEDVLLDAQPTKQFVTSRQVAEAALFLCSEAASQITGANIAMDGGWTAQ